MHFPLLISGHHRDCRQTPRLGAAGSALENRRLDLFYI